MTIPKSREIKARQRFLKSKGFDPGPVDGIEGEWTKKAEMYYQGSIPHSAKPIPDVGHEDRNKVLRSAIGMVGAQKQKMICAAEFITLCGNAVFGSTNNPYPRSTLASDKVANPTWQQGINSKTPKPAAVFGIYFASRSRVSHAGLILEWTDGSPFFLSIEAEEDTIRMKRRMKSDVHSVRDWIG